MRPARSHIMSCHSATPFFNHKSYTSSLATAMAAAIVIDAMYGRNEKSESARMATHKICRSPSMRT